MITTLSLYSAKHGLNHAMTSANIVAGFQTTGVFPINRDAISLPGESGKDEFLEPRPVYTPFKRFPVQDGMFSSAY